jgi:cytochrome P450
MGPLLKIGSILAKSPLAEVTGQGLLTGSGDFWLQQRRLCQPAFNRLYLPQMATVIVQAAEQLCQRWQKLAADKTIIELRAIRSAVSPSAPGMAWLCESS